MLLVTCSVLHAGDNGHCADGVICFVSGAALLCDKVVIENNFVSHIERYALWERSFICPQAVRYTDCCSGFLMKRFLTYIYHIFNVCNANFHADEWHCAGVLEMLSLYVENINFTFSLFYLLTSAPRNSNPIIYNKAPQAEQYYQNLKC
jgi:hypothetical protein